MDRSAPSWLLLAALLPWACVVGDGAFDRDKDGVKAELDCNDADPNVAPGLPELCGNGIDDDCDGIADGVDTGVGAVTFFADRDGDGYGDPDITATACATPPLGYVADSDDCDDEQPSVNPGRLDDTCDGVDDNCDGTIDEDATLADWFEDLDGDGFGAGEPLHTCDPDEGWVRSSGDCDDADNRRYPGADEVCNGIDDNCIDGVDEGLLGTGEACTADSCQDLFDELGDDADGVFWLDDDGTPYEAECDVDDDYGGGWMVVDLPFVADYDLVTFESGGARGGVARWTADGTGIELDTASGSVCDSDPRWVLANIALPELYTEIRGGFTLAPLRPSTWPHTGLDNDTVLPRFREAPRCDGTDYRGSVLFGNDYELVKRSGLTDDWSGSTDADYVFRQDAPVTSREAGELLLQLAGVHPTDHTGGVLTQLRVYVR